MKYSSFALQLHQHLLPMETVYKTRVKQNETDTKTPRMLLYFRNEPCLLASQRGTACLKVVLFPRPSARTFCPFSISFWSALRQKTPVSELESFGVKTNDILYSESLRASVFSTGTLLSSIQLLVKDASRQPQDRYSRMTATDN